MAVCNFYLHDIVTMNRCFFFVKHRLSLSVRCLKCTTVFRNINESIRNVARITLTQKIIRLNYCFIGVSCNCHLLSDEHEKKNDERMIFIIHSDGWQNKRGVCVTRAMWNALLSIKCSFSSLLFEMRKNKKHHTTCVTHTIHGIEIKRTRLNQIQWN